MLELTVVQGILQKICSLNRRKISLSLR